MVAELLSEVTRGVGRACRDEVRFLGETVNDNEDTVVATRERELYDVVHRDRKPRSRGCR